jgi:hypothetical protein
MPAIGGQLIIDAQQRSALLSRVTEDLKKKGASNESRWLMGQPDVDARGITKGQEKGKLQVEVHGFDYYETRSSRATRGAAPCGCSTPTTTVGASSSSCIWHLDPLLALGDR